MNAIKWMLGVGCVFASIGSTVLVHLMADGIERFFKRRANLRPEQK